MSGSLFGVPPASAQSYAHLHEDKHAALTQPLPIAQEGTTGTRSARRRPLATAGTLEQQHEPHRTGREPYGRDGHSLREALQPAEHTAQAAAVGSTETAQHPCLSQLSLSTVHHYGNRKSAQCSGAGRIELARGRASGIGNHAERPTDGAPCNCAKVMLTHEALSTKPARSVDCLYRRPDCSYQKRSRCALPVDIPKGHTSTAHPPSARDGRELETPRRTAPQPPRINFWGHPRLFLSVKKNV